MCYAIPARILSIEGEEAEADYGGVIKRINISLLDDLKVGEYVLIHTGFAIERLKEEGALAAIRTIRESIALSEGDNGNG